MEDGPTRTHTLHTIGGSRHEAHCVTGCSTGSGLLQLDTQHTAHRTAHEVALCSGVHNALAGKISNDPLTCPDALLAPIRRI